ncbi:MAG: alcohol dehydrogenase, partial [Enterococcus sp.]|nr:alcohol dehydrogenase [Enterococcus sp.]
DLPQIAEDALRDVCTPGNPRQTSLEDIIALYTSLM